MSVTQQLDDALRQLEDLGNIVPTLSSLRLKEQREPQSSTASTTQDDIQDVLFMTRLYENEVARSNNFERTLQMEQQKNAILTKKVALLEQQLQRLGCNLSTRVVAIEHTDSPEASSPNYSNTSSMHTERKPKMRNVSFMPTTITKPDRRLEVANGDNFSPNMNLSPIGNGVSFSQSDSHALLSEKKKRHSHAHESSPASASSRSPLNLRPGIRISSAYSIRSFFI